MHPMATEQVVAVKNPIIEALERSDADRRPGRADRIRWSSHYALDGAIMGPVEALALLREARDCFVDGHYVATLMLATAIIEHVISEELVSANAAKYGIAFESAIKLARGKQLFPPELLDIADRLRLLRNPFAHRKPDEHEHTLGNRYTAQQRHPLLIAEEDARAALVAMYTHIKVAYFVPDGK